ncbi:MAG: iron transporter permease [Marmoricola sp.]|nr:iron transporter permease [Marmoricola sp.]
MLVPLGYVAWYTWSLGPVATWDLIARPRVGELLRNTVGLLLGAMALSTLIGVACAWLVERSDLPLRRVWHVLFVAPLAIPAFVNSYGWVSLTHAVQGYAGAVLVVSLSYAPLVYLPTVAAMRTLDPALEEVAHSLGLDRWTAFRRVVLSGVRPGVLGGALLVGLHVLAEFGALQMLRFPTFTTAIYDHYRSAFNSAPANVLAGVLVLGCLLLLVAELSLRGDVALWRVGAGSARSVDRVRLGPMRPVALCAALVLVTLSLGVPVSSLVHWLLVGSSTDFPAGELVSATVTTAGLGLGAAAVTVVLALPVVWLAVRHRGRLANLIERATFTAHALPGIVVALALVAVSIRSVRPLYQTLPLLLLGYAILFLPRAVVSIRSSLEHAQPVLEDVARSLGERPAGVLVRVTLPLIRNGLGAGAALVFLAVSTELTATLLMAPIGTSTLATEFWSNSSSLAYGAAAPYALLLVVVSLPATWLLSRQARGGVLA